MAKGTLIFLIILALFATLLIGIRIGKNSYRASETIIPTPSPIPSLIPTAQPTLSPTTIVKPTKNPVLSDEPKTTSNVQGTSTYSNGTCGFTVTFPGGYLKSNTQNEYSVILTNENDASQSIATTCADTIPRPPVSSDKIESITLDGQVATLYHDTDDNGKSREIVIVKHPKTGKEIIIAGPNPVFQSVLSSFKFQ